MFSSSVVYLFSFLWGGGGVISSVMDTLNTLLLGWLFTALLILILAKFLYDKFLRGNEDEEYIINRTSNITSDKPSSDHTRKQTETNDKKKNIEPRRVPTIIPKVEFVTNGSASEAAGQDADAVKWINQLMKWLYRGPHKAVSSPYLNLLNEMTVQTALETGVLIEVLEILPSTPTPHINNVVVDCFPDDSMNITCDCKSSIYLRLQVTRTHGDQTNESEYVAAIEPFIGRVNSDLNTHLLQATLKFDGWPEVPIELEGIQNNEVGLGEKELQEVIKEVVSSALRTMVLNLDMKAESTFPRFKRSRDIPEKVMPVGYDSMVREHQTHPPLLKSKVLPKPREIPSVSLRNRKQNSSVLEDLGYDVLKPAVDNNNSLLTQNFSAGLTSSEEQLISRNLNDYGSDRDSQNGDGVANLEVFERQAELTNKSRGKSYVPPGFLEQVTAVALAKVSQRSLANMKSSSQDLDTDVSEEPTISRNLCDTGRDSLIGHFPKLEHDNERLSWDKGYVPPGFLEQVTAVALAKVSEKSLSAMKGSSQEQDFDEFTNDGASDQTNDIPLFDYIPYDSEYEEDEDVDDYLERDQVVKKEPVMRSPFERQPVKPKEYGLEESRKPNSIDDQFPNKTIGNPPPIGAMGLPHHPKSHFAQSLVPSPPPPGLAILNGKRLLVKIVKATGVGCGKSSVTGNVVVEMDEPAQKFQTATVRGSNSPHWDEQFLFDLSDSTLELLFELYDESDSSFLGLGIVGIEELVATPSQRQIIPLQARPYENDVVSGSLTVEFLFLEGGELPELSTRKLASIQLNSNAEGATKTTTYTRDNREPLTVNGHTSSSIVADIALRDINKDNIAIASNANKSTLIIHASKKPEDEEDETVNMGYDDNYIVNTLHYPFPESGSDSKTIATINAATSAAKVTANNVTSMNDTVDESSEIEDDGRGRSRNKKKSFFGSLKKRFSRSKQRSQSMQPGISPAKRESTPTDAPRTATVGRSVSMERSQRLRPTDEKEKRKSVPLCSNSQSQRSEHPTGLLSVPKSDSREIGAKSDTGSTRSSLSELSGLSSSSTRTYVNDASMLIVETVENGVVKHYLVPVSLQQRNKWRKRGTKLHVFSGHTFVAKHISSSITCSVCSKKFNRRPGKQGYECRDCGLVSHKPCHVRTEEQCPNSKVNNMDLVYIKDPREERKAQKNQRFKD